MTKLNNTNLVITIIAPIITVINVLFMDDKTCSLFSAREHDGYGHNFDEWNNCDDDNDDDGNDGDEYKFMDGKHECTGTRPEKEGNLTA